MPTIEPIPAQAGIHATGPAGTCDVLAAKPWRVERQIDTSALGTGRSLSSGRLKAGPVGRDGKAKIGAGRSDELPGPSLNPGCFPSPAKLYSVAAKAEGELFGGAT